MSVGRNDPCPCGSGEKYKKCCLGSEGAGALPRDEQLEMRNAAFEALSRYSARGEFREERQAAFEGFMGDALDGPLDPDATETKDAMLKFAFYWLFDWRLDNGTTVCDTFLRRAARQVDVQRQAVLRRLAAARLRPYEVAEIELDLGLTLHDLWSDETVYVTERMATRQLHRGDLLAARVAAEDDGTFRFETPYLFPPRSKATLMDALRTERQDLEDAGTPADDDAFFRHCAPLIQELWLDLAAPRPMPTVVTAEGGSTA